MPSKSTVTISLLIALLVPSSVYGAPVQGLVSAKLDTREPMLVVPKLPNIQHLLSRPWKKTKRDVEEELLTRDPLSFNPRVHPAALHHFKRFQVNEEDLVTRGPIFGMIRNIFRGGKRDLEGLEELDARVWDDLVEREPIFGMIKNIFRGGRRDFGGEEELSARELEELAEREPIFGMIRNIFRGGKRDLELAELSEREPLLPLLLGGTLLASSMGKKRDFIDSYHSEMFERQTDDDFIVARERFGSLDELD